MFLWRTDIRDLSELDSLPVPGDQSGTHRAELDTAAAENGWIVIRTYRAPGIAPEVAEYVAVRQDGVLRTAAHVLETRALPDTLVVHEDTGTGIPAAGLWLVYDPD